MDSTPGLKVPDAPTPGPGPQPGTADVRAALAAAESLEADDLPAALEGIADALARHLDRLPRS